jgi:arylsulfatase A
VTSDNGYRHKFFPGQKQPLHGAKWWVWQGGLRVPMVVTGPGIRSGSQCTANVVNTDFLPTFVAWAGGDPARLKDIDGVSLAGILEGDKVDAAFATRSLYFHYPHYRTSMPHSTLVAGTWKVMHFYEQPGVPMLFHLPTDQGEVNNVALKYPEKHKALHDEMMQYFKEVGARLPKQNPKYDPAVYKKAKNTSNAGPGAHLKEYVPWMRMSKSASPLIELWSRTWESTSSICLDARTQPAGIGTGKHLVTAVIGTANVR